MKWSIALAVGVALIFAPAADAAELEYNSYRADILVNQDASIRVEEEITVNFLNDKHGIFRNIPYAYRISGSSKRFMPIEDIDVKVDGQPVPLQRQQQGDEIRLKIGDPDRTTRGVHVYRITYTVKAAVNFLSGHDELYWNVTGHNWDEPLTNVVATVSLPEGATITQAACYTGAFGSTARDCTQSVNGARVDFTAKTFLTVVVGWPKDIVTKPSNYDQLRTQDPFPSPLVSALRGEMLWVNILLALGGVFWAVRRWQMYGRDPGQRRTIIAQYDPRDGLSPSELYTIMHEDTPRPAIAATIVDLAVRGYLKIIQTERKTKLGLGRATDFRLRSVKALDQNLRPFERNLLEVLFEKQLFPAADNEIAVTDLKKRRYQSDPFAPVLSEVISEVTRRKYFVSNPREARSRTVWLGIGLAALGTATFWVGSWPLFGLIVAGLVILLTASTMPKRTASGVEAAWAGHGFRLFLKTAEKYRAEWQARQGIFERYLPYAMLFGVANEWSRALASAAAVQLSWYEGPTGAPLNSLVFWSAFSAFTSDVAAASAVTAASGGSGFSGGFSGGGGGGGGGGGW